MPLAFQSVPRTFEVRRGVSPDADYSSILSYEIISDLKLGLEFYYNYDNRSFAENGPYDLGVLINVQYEF